MNESRLPLAGIRVIDLTRVLAGPYATMLMADMGAEVIKVESENGDDTRHWGPPFAGTESAYFLSVNRGKRSVLLDLATPAGRDQLRQLAETADVVVENFRQGRMTEWGVGFEQLRAANRRLIYAAITGFGSTGPAAKLPGYATLVEAMSGLMSITGSPEGEPMKVGVALVDVIAGCHLVGAVNAALLRRERTGVGGRIDVSLLESCISALANQAGNVLVTGEDPDRHGNAHPNIVPYQLFAARDRPVMLAVGNDRQFARFARMLGAPHWADDPRFATNQQRVIHRVELVDDIAARFAGRSAQHWLDQAVVHDVPLAAVNTISEALASPEVASLNLVHATNHRSLDRALSIRHPVLFDGEAPTSSIGPPELGQHTAAVLHPPRDGDQSPMGLPSRFAVSGHHFDSSPSDLAASLRSLGARGIDVWPWNLGDDHHSAAAAFAASGLQIITINVPGATARLCDPAGDEALVEAANDAIDLAVELGAPMVSLYAAPGTSRNALSASDELASSLAAVLERAELSHVTLTVENNLDQRGEDLHRSNPSRSPEVLARTMQLLDSKWVGIAFDPCNFTTVLTEPYPYAYELLRPWIRNVHIKDCTRYDPARHRALPARNKLLIDSHGGAHLPRPVGSGAVPWPQIIDELANDGYAGWWTLDPFITASELAAWCRESVSWLEGYRAFADPAHHEVTGPTRGPSSEPLEAPSR